MAKRRNRPKPKSTTQSQPKGQIPKTPSKQPQKSTPKKAAEEPVSKKIDALSKEVSAKATPDEIKSLEKVTPQKEQTESPQELYKKLFDIKGLLDKRSERIEEEERKLEKKREELKLLLEESEKLEEERRLISERHVELMALDEELRLREADADIGFAKRNRESLEKFDEEVKKISQVLSETRAQIARERADFEDEIGKKKKELEEERDNLARQRKELEGQFRDLEVEKELFEDDREAQNKRVERLSASQIAKMEIEKERLEEKLKVAHEERKTYENKYEKLHNAKLKFGNRSLEDIKEEIETLRSENERLLEELEERPSKETIERLKDLEKMQDDWEADVARLKIENAQLRRNVDSCNIAVTELEALKDYNKALESRNALLRESNEELIKDIEGRLAKDGENPFPACTKMDKDRSLQTKGKLMDSLGDLSEFAQFVRHKIASNEALYYSERDIRSFIGGLAMSRLHLLEGISGTGKTSLPREFAAAIGAPYKLIEVQAGWRDRQDLIGYYNTFERRYYESEFLQALYQALCKRYEDQPYIVILDEMNLSYPEHYFADLLSVLEQKKPEDQYIPLMTAPVELAPKRLLEKRNLPVPKNVWFVGTANKDETTKDFADKTYDRSHVMELPKGYLEFDPKPEKYGYDDPISFQALQEAFSEAEQKYGESADIAYRFLEKNLELILNTRFGISWGNRLHDQVKKYVPVVIAAGGDIGEALDQLIATKVLRKLKDRHDNRREHLSELKDAIEEAWDKLRSDERPIRTAEVLKGELIRQGYSGDDFQ